MATRRRYTKEQYAAAVPLQEKLIAELEKQHSQPGAARCAKGELMSTQQNDTNGGTPSPERLGSPVIYCANCGCKVGHRHRRKTNKSYYVHELSKGHKETACKKPHVHFVDRLTPHKRRLLKLGMEELRRRFMLENTGREAR